MVQIPAPIRSQTPKEGVAIQDHCKEGEREEDIPTRLELEEEEEIPFRSLSPPFPQGLVSTFLRFAHKAVEEQVGTQAQSPEPGQGCKQEPP